MNPIKTDIDQTSRGALLSNVQQVGAMRQRALTLAGLGLHVFALTARNKNPIDGSHGHLDATTDPAKIDAMWRSRTFSNVGINCGASDIYVVDVDMNPWKNKQGGRTWAALVGEHGHVDTLTVRTWSGGRHFYYRMPEGMRLRNTTGTSGGRGLGLDIDTRGEGGFVVGPGSFVREIDGGEVHEGTYEIEHDLSIAPLPDWIIERVKDRERPAAVVAGPVAPDDLVTARVQELADELQAAPDGEGNHVAARVSFMAGQYVGAGQVDQDETIATLLDAVSGWSWRSGADERSMHSTIIRGVQDGTHRPRAWERPVATNSQPVAPASTATATQPQEAADAVMVLEEDLDTPDGIEKEVKKPADPEKEQGQSLSDWATDLGQAHHLLDRLEQKVMHADGVGWHSWTGTHWAPVSKDFVSNRIVAFYRVQFRAMLKKFASTEDDKFMILAKAYKSFMSTSRIAAIMKMLSVIDGVFADPARLDRHDLLLNTPSGVVNLCTKEIMKHDPDLLMTKITSGRYRPGFRHADWDKALTALPPEQADYMQIRMGQAATGHNAKDVVFLVGVGANGKSAYSTEGVFPALGEYAYMAQPTLISKGQGTGATPDRASLRGVRFALIEELPESHALSVEEIKRIADTAVITARMLHMNPITFTATHTLFVTSNSMPSVAEVDHGTWRRLLLVDFPYTFVEKPETVWEREGDPTLKRRIRDNTTGQHDAIVTWLVDGAARYLADPMLVEIERRPLEVREAIKAWQMSADRIMAFFTECLVPDPNGVVARPDLYHQFATFLAAQGHAKWSQETFLTRFRVHEMARRAGVTEGQTRNHEQLSRPPLPPGVLSDSTMPRLPGVVRILRGLRFRDDQED